MLWLTNYSNSVCCRSIRVALLVIWEKCFKFQTQYSKHISASWSKLETFSKVLERLRIKKVKNNKTWHQFYYGMGDEQFRQKLGTTEAKLYNVENWAASLLLIYHLTKMSHYMQLK